MNLYFKIKISIKIKFIKIEKLYNKKDLIYKLLNY